jgi:hypothetical protein
VLFEDKGEMDVDGDAEERAEESVLELRGEIIESKRPAQYVL